MAKRRSAHRRCPYRIWTRVTSKVKLLCCSGLTQDFRRSFSSMDRIWICSAPSIRKIYCRCWAVGMSNFALEKYLVGQVLESPEERFAALREFFPNAKEKDWRLEVAGQRVQIIKKDPTHGGVLQFGTELVGAADGSIIAMLGASPGGSTAVAIMVQ